MHSPTEIEQESGFSYSATRFQRLMEQCRDAHAGMLATENHTENQKITETYDLLLSDVGDALLGELWGELSEDLIREATCEIVEQPAIYQNVRNLFARQRREKEQAEGEKKEEERAYKAHFISSCERINKDMARVSKTPLRSQSESGLCKKEIEEPLSCEKLIYLSQRFWASSPKTSPTTVAVDEDAWNHFELEL